MQQLMKLYFISITNDSQIEGNVYIFNSFIKLFVTSQMLSVKAMHFHRLLTCDNFMKLVWNSSRDFR